MDTEAARTIAALALQPHPEGGYYRELFRSPHGVRATDGRVRAALTVIYFLLTQEAGSTWHRLRSDETWHFASGGSVALDLIDKHGRHEELRLGPDGPWHAVVPAETVFAARAVAGFALVTCCVAPGFDFADFELLPAAELARIFPQHAATIARYAR